MPGLKAWNVVATDSTPTTVSSHEPAPAPIIDDWQPQMYSGTGSIAQVLGVYVPPPVTAAIMAILPPGPAHTSNILSGSGFADRQGTQFVVNE